MRTRLRALAITILTTLACAPVGPDALEIPGDDAVEDHDSIVAPDLEPLEDPVAVDLPTRKCGKNPLLERPVELEDPLAARGGVLKTKVGKRWMGLPLRETTFDTVVVGTMAETTVTQLFVNDFDDPIEAIYTFPLPHDGGVDDYWFRIADRTIAGLMKLRDEARELYEEAKQDGKSASLLEQERANIFTQSVANIPPGESIRVGMHIVQPLGQDEGRYSLALPLVVGPRFIPGAATGHAGSGMVPDTDRVPDASRITPPVLPLGFRTCGDVKISVTIDAGLPVRALRSKSHRVRVERERDGALVELDDDYALLNKDFLLSWRLAGKRSRASLLTQRVDDLDYFTLSVQPPKTLRPSQAIPRELVFVIDASGSMSGAPMEAAKDTMRRFIGGLNPDDRFQVIRFSEDASGLGPDLIANTPGNVKRAIDYIDALAGGGGTMMTEGIRAALDMPHDEDRMRIVVFLTDGYIGNESEIFSLIARDGGEARLFALGVGSAPNRYLLEGMADMGRGAVSYVGLEDDPEPVVERLYEQLAFPVLRDVSIDWGGLDVAEVVPADLPDLFVGQPIVLYGKYSGGLSGSIKVQGRVGARDVEIPVRVRAARTDRAEGVASMWARARIGELLLDPKLARERNRYRDWVEREVTNLSLGYSVLTEYTAFVAIDNEPMVDGSGRYHTIVQGVDLAEGMAHEYVFGHIGPRPDGDDEGAIGSGSGSGYGAGYGGGFGGRGKRVPSVRTAHAFVRGGMDRAIIRRIVRAHINEIRGCYNQALVRDPKLSGRIVIQWTLAADGSVSVAVVERSDFEDRRLGKCITSHVKRWRFPRSDGGGTVIVHYPFVLSVPEDDAVVRMAD